LIREPKAAPNPLADADDFLMRSGSIAPAFAEDAWPPLLRAAAAASQILSSGDDPPGVVVFPEICNHAR
jgi:hypothetical protein